LAAAAGRGGRIEVGLAAVREHVVAIGPAGGAGDLAHRGHAGRRAVLRRARVAAGAAVGDARGGIDPPARAQRAAVGVGPARRAGAVAHAAGAARLRHVVARARARAGAAVVRVAEQRHLAAVDLFVAIAVGVSGQAGAIAYARAARDGDQVVRRAHRGGAGAA